MAIVGVNFSKSNKIYDYSSTNFTAEELSAATHAVVNTPWSGLTVVKIKGIAAEGSEDNLKPLIAIFTFEE